MNYQIPELPLKLDLENRDILKQVSAAQRSLAELKGLSHTIPAENVEYWLARDFMPYLGYTRWENFVEAIRRAETACTVQKNNVSDHFRDVTKMIDLPKGAKREIVDVMLSRYACYLIAMNGDSSTCLPSPKGAQ